MINGIKTALIKLFKGAVIRTALLNGIKAALKVPNVNAWILNFIIEHFYEEIFIPIFNRAINRVGYYLDQVEGKIIVKKLNTAREVNDAKEYDKILDDLFNASKR